jgi:SAM-dependent methyltransferase
MINDKKIKIESILKKEPIINRDNAYVFIEHKKILEISAGNSLKGYIQSYCKKWGDLYSQLVLILGPVISSIRFKKLQKTLLAKYTKDSIVLSIGSGPHVYMGRNDIINCDLFEFPNVDIVCEVSSLPIKDNSVDYIINVAMLEHVKNPNIIIQQMLRVSKKDGIVLCWVPFIQPFHAAPEDYFRWTKNGAKELFKDFSSVDVGIGAGPTSGMLWIVQEWLSLVLSFGNSALKDIIFLILMVLTFPVKYLDIIFERYPNADKLASGFYIYAKK